MQKKSLQTILYSSAGVVVMLALVVAVNVIFGAYPFRADLTREKAYTLSPGTKAVLGKLDAPVVVRFYCTQAETATPETVFLKDYARQVEDLLHEYKMAAGKNLVIQKFDPEPDSDAEDSARMDGLEPQQFSDGDNFYLGLSISIADQRVAIPFLEPNREKLLEYDITRAITEVQEPQKPTIGIMSALPVFGEQPNPEMQMQMPNQQGTPPWTLVQQLQQDFNVQQIPMDTDKIDDSIGTLMVIYPAGISDKTEYALDQFVLRGGKLIAFLDPQSTLMARQQQNPMMGGGNTSASLDKLLQAWGIQFDTSKVVADLDLKMELENDNGQQMENPAWLALTPDGINQNDVVTSEIDSLWLPTVGAFTGEPVAGLKETVLLHSSKEAELTDAMMAGMGGEAVMNGFKATGVNYDLAIRLTGKFKTAFPGGEPKDESAGTNTVAKAADNSLKESKTDTSVVLVGDSDMLADDFSLQKQNTPLGEMVNALNANLNFAQNLVEQMAGDSNLIGLRSRGSISRPFTRIKKLEAAAEATGQEKINELQQSLQDTEQKLNDLQQQNPGKDQKLILSPQQQAEIDNFRKKQAEVSRELRQAQKDLRREVVSLETQLTWLNILAMPCAITMAGVTTALIKRKKTSAK
ncbi:MAG TPA: Gldg family protein [Candidatus Acidoferrales bacterium]|nr:Gldg family protein [Candidatus Acidoferrales bacterium]